MKTTTSLCTTCYRTVPAEIFETDGTVRLRKHCPTHGHQEAIIETDPAFYAETQTTPDPGWFRNHVSVTLLDVTDRCNVRCPHCYHMPGQIPDRPIAEIVAQARGCTKAQRGFVLMGAEPTMRRDLPELVSEMKTLGKDVVVYTNGIKLASARLVASVERAGLDGVAFSLHTSDYLGVPALWLAKQRALRHLGSSSITIDHVSISLRTLADLPEALEIVAAVGPICTYVRLRCPSAIGTCRDQSFFLSDFFHAVAEACAARGKEVFRLPADNGPYHVMVQIDGVFVRLIRWPSVHEVDMGQLDCPPYALFVPEVGETNFVHQALLQEAIRTGRLSRSDLAGLKHPIGSGHRAYF